MVLFWQRWPQWRLPVGIFSLLGLVSAGGLTDAGHAQIIPDDSLGAESSQVTVDGITGGAQRGASLFHSFAEFSIGDGQAVYFADPAGIQAIFSRVTGGGASEILGTLGVDGDASLYFLNPNGILFGPNAQLDISGAFVASTAEEFLLGDGLRFSAVSPALPPLLNVNVTPGLQYGTVQPGTTIASQGRLVAGQDLSLVADNLNLQGELWAGENLTLAAEATVQVRDSAAVPFVAAAGGNLLLQGGQVVDIFALNHPDSGLLAGNDLILRSAGPVNGDAHYWNGGGFRVEQLDGSLQNWESTSGTLIRALGNVGFRNYQGGSLHVIAGGSVEFSSAIVLRQAGLASSVNPINTPQLVDMALSDGTKLTVDGSSRAVVDIRAGVGFEAIGNPFTDSTRVASSPPIGAASLPSPPFPNPSLAPAGVGITIGDVAVNAPRGLVLLTNQYRPNPDTAAPDIQFNNVFTDAFAFTGDAGTIVVDSRGSILSSVNSESVFLDTRQINSSSSSGAAGNVALLANDSVVLEGATVESVAGSDQAGGSIVVRTNDLTLRNAARITTFATSSGEGGDLIVNARGSIQLSDRFTGLFAGTDNVGEAGDLVISTRNLDIQSGAQISASTFGDGNAGNLIIDAAETVRVAERSADGRATSSIAAQANPDTTGDAGSVSISTQDLIIQSGGRVSANTFGFGDAGDLVVNASHSITVSGVSSDGRVASTLRTSAEEVSASAEAGNMIINTSSLRVQEGASVSTSTFGGGNAGDLIINVAEVVEVIGSAVFEDGETVESSIVSQANRFSTGDSGRLTINTSRLSLQSGGFISTASFGDGDSGDLTIASSGLVQVNGRSQTGQSGSSLSTQVFDRGDGGNLVIDSEQLLIENGGFVSTATFGSGDAGNLTVEASERVRLAGTSPGGAPSSLLTETAGAGRAGEILSVTTGQLDVLAGATISASSQGDQAASRVDIAAARVRLDAGAVLSQSPSGNGGNLNFQIGDLILLDNNSRISTSAGTAAAGGDGGNIAINAPSGFLIGVEATDSDIIAQAFEGSGGNIDIEAQGIYGLEERPAIAGNGTNDIDASSQFGQSGSVTISDPTVDPSRASVELPADVLNAADLVDRSCQADAGESQSSLVVTGRGGLPPAPAEVVRSYGDALIDLELDGDGGDEASGRPSPTARPAALDADSDRQSAAVVEARTWHRNDSGQVVLTAQNGAYRIENMTPFSCQESPVEGTDSRGMP